MTEPPQKKADLLANVLQMSRADGAVPCCPECGAQGLEIKDLSARPHTEWYRFTCSDCGLNETLAVPQAVSGQSGIT